MTTPLTQMPKPEAAQYSEDRKLYLVPTFLFGPDVPEDGQQVLERYWSDVRDHVHNLERTLGKVAHVYHEGVFGEGDEGLSMVDDMNLKGSAFIKAMCHSDASLEALEDRELVMESADWQRCISIGLASQKVLSLALESYEKATAGRYEHIASRIDETLKEGESGVLFIRQEHRVQFPSDVRVFYVAPPSLDALKRWIDNQIRTASAPEQPPEESTETAS